MWADYFRLPIIQLKLEYSDRRPTERYRNHGEVFAFAGLWDRSIDPQGKALETCAILTTTPNRHLSDIHDRMPVILNPGDYDTWLNPQIRDASRVSRLLVPYAGVMRRYQHPV